MARRSGRKNAWLATDDYSGFTRYASELREDYWGAWTKNPLERNLQEIASPLNDPQPVPLYRGPNYEVWPYSTYGFIIPDDVGVTNVPTNRDNMAIQVLGSPSASGQSGVGYWQIGSTFKVS
jgi:hypothetical protein